MTDFYILLIKLFKPEDISRLIPDSPEVKDIDEIFRQLTKHNIWNFQDISKLKKITKKFMKGDASLSDMMKEYEFKLNGYWINTKIIDKIRSDQFKKYNPEDYPSTPSTKYDTKFRRELSMRLFDDKGGRELPMRSMEFVKNVWEEFSDTFRLTLESVLDKIVMSCIEISWFILSMSAQNVLEYLNEEALDFFQRKYIFNVTLEGTVIYDSKNYGIASAKVSLKLFCMR